MLGWFNSSIEAFLKESFGIEKWLEILAESGVSSSYPWVSSCPFSNHITTDLLQTASKQLEITKETLMEEYGAFFISYIQSQGYAKLLTVLGGDVVEFFDNLNNLHLHLTLAQPAMQAPSFRCEKVTPESVELHYFSPHDGLHPIVVGMLKAVAQHVFAIQLSLKLIQSREDGSDHEVFLVQFPFQQSIQDRMNSEEIIASDPFEPFEMSPLLFAELHPFHIVVDKSFTVLQVGQVLARILPELTSGVHIRDHIQIKMPRVGFSWEDIKREMHGPFLLRTLSTGLELKGQMLITGLPIPGCPHEPEVLVFMGSPRCANLGELHRHRLFLSDIPIHDMSGDFVLLAEQRQAESDLKERFENLTHELKAEKARSDALVQRMSGLLACFPFKAAKEKASDINALAQSLDISNSGCRNEAQDRLDLIEAVRRAMGPITSSFENEEEIELVEAIGEGTYGKVYRGLWQGTEVAVKTIILPANMSGSEKREKMAIMEAAISSSLSHPNIVQTYTYSIKPMRDQAVAAAAGLAACNGMSGTVKRGDAKPVMPPFGAKQEPEGASVGTSYGGIGIVLGGATDMFSDGAPGADGLAAQAAQAALKPAAQATINETPSGGASGSVGGTGKSKIEGEGGTNSSSKGSGGAIHSYEIRLVLEFCDRGSLRDVLDDNIFKLADGSTNYKAMLDTALDIAKAMLHLHRNDVLHADLKARNIMLRSAGDSGKGFSAKVADFGLSVKIHPDETHMSDMCQGTLTHMAPELMLEGQMSKAADVYAFGILLWELYTAGSPYKGTPRALLGHQVTAQDKRPVFPADTPPEYKKLSQWCWEKDPKSRPIFEEIMQDLIEMRRSLPGPTPLALKPPASNTEEVEPKKLFRLAADVVAREDSGDSFYPSDTLTDNAHLNMGGATEAVDFGSALVGQSLHTEM